MNYLLYGYDSFLLKQELATLLKKNGQETDINTVYYDGQANDFSIEKIVEDANMISLFTQNKVIIVNNPLFLAGQTLDDEQTSILEQYLQNSSLFTDLIFYVEQSDQYMIDQRKKAFKLLTKYCRVSNIKMVSAEEFGHIVKSDLNKYKIVIKPDAIDELIQRLPIDITNWKNELLKLYLYQDSLDKKDIKHLVARSLDDNVFIMVNAVMRKNLKLAIEAWRDLSVMKHDPIELIAILAAQFRFMYQCKILAKKYDNKQIAEMLNAKVARVNITMNNSSNVTSENIMALLAKLADLDQKIKNGIIDKQLGFELFLIEATR